MRDILFYAFILFLLGDFNGAINFVLEIIAVDVTEVNKSRLSASVA